MACSLERVVRPAPTERPLDRRKNTRPTGGGMMGKAAGKG